MLEKIVSLLLILCFLFSVLALSSCGKGEKPAETTAPETEPTLTVPTASDAGIEEATTAEVTTDKWEEIAPKITMIAEKDRTLKIECSSRQTAVKGSKNDIYLKGPDAIVDGETPLIEVMVYERNKAAADLLGIKTDFVFWDLEFGLQQEPIELAVKGNAPDAPDLFVNMLNDVSHAMLNGVFKDVWSIPNSFFDFSAAGWLDAWMRNLSFSGDRAYILGSDYFIDVFRSMSVLPFNMTMMDANAGRLAPAILPDGETLGPGEELTPRFFDLVETGGWTWDVLGKLCEAIWVDSDGDGADSIKDQLGILTDTYGGDAAAGFVYTCGLPVTEDYWIEDETDEKYAGYHGKKWIKYSDDPTVLNLIFDAVKDVFDGKGSFTTAENRPFNTPEKPGLAYHYTKFAAGEVLFIGSLLLAAIETETIQQMPDLFSVVPCPKVNASDSYNTIIYNSGDVGAINVNINPRKGKTLSAYLQFCTENSGAIREQFQEIVMKYKVTTYDQGTDRMFNIIYNAILWGRDKTIEDVNVEPRWHGKMRENKFTVGSEFIAKLYSENLSKKQSKLDSVMKTWYTLPKVEPEGN